MGSSSSVEIKLAEDFFNNFITLIDVRMIEKICNSSDFQDLLLRVEYHKRYNRPENFLSKLQNFLGTYDIFCSKNLDFETTKNVIGIVRELMFTKIDYILTDVDIIDILSLNFWDIMFHQKLNKKIMIKIEFTNISNFLKSTDHLFPNNQNLTYLNYYNNTKSFNESGDALYSSRLIKQLTTSS